MAVNRKRKTLLTVIFLVIVLYLTFSVFSELNEVLKEEKELKLESPVEKFEALLEIPNNNISQDDPRLIQFISKKFIHSPDSSLDYNLSKHSLKGGNGQAVLVDRILRRKQNGFFIEAGAFDGEYLSNTLYFELKRNWTGILIEPNSKVFEKLLAKRRKAFSLNACLAITQNPQQVVFDSADVYGSILEKENDINDHKTNFTLKKLRDEVDKSNRFTEKVQCLPLYSILLALGNPKVDYLSLDVEGAEVDVLKTIPFHKVNIRVMTVENIHSDDKEIIKVLVNNGFKVHQRLQSDIVFVKRN